MEDAVSNTLELLYSILQIRGDKYKLLPKYFEATENRCEVLKGLKVWSI